MGREQKRKEQKKYKNKKVENEIMPEDMIKMSTILKIIIGVVIVILIFYYGLAIFVTKEVDLSSNKKDTSTSETNSNNVSNAILAKNTFNQLDDIYYVYFYNFNKEEEVISNSISNLTDHTIYRVDAASGLNKNYIDNNTSNRNVTSIDNLRVKSPTIIKIDNDKVVSYYEGVEEISKFLNK
ncbi:MAG: hypothetical protein VZS44_07070 [Bacilli bacterium]|nr:hypothetical protein [Bacilli bacterium]